MTDTRDFSQSIQTFTGRYVFPLDPRPEDFCPEDIAHALSNMCRFTGHCCPTYVVADHSIRVSEIVPPEDALWGLMHDATEAYLVDLPRPLKRAGAFGEMYREFECRLMMAICDWVGLPHQEPESVRVADKVLLLTEKRDLMRRTSCGWVTDRPEIASPLPVRIVPRSPGKAEVEFLRRFTELTRAY